MVAEQLLRDPALFQRAFSTTPSTPYGKALPAALPLIHEYLEPLISHRKHILNLLDFIKIVY